jgi:hypothetical protein
MALDRCGQFQCSFRIFRPAVGDRNNQHPGRSIALPDGENDRARPILGAFLATLPMLPQP